jgi:uroporphyrin-III C-methyltransferase / precorrin-2 dehydrogenase / sirohydrochlorin ferrochelatase
MLKDIPRDDLTPRMQPLSRLPVFFALEGKRVVVAGGTPAAAWKAELLSAAGAVVDVFARSTCDALCELASHPPQGPVIIHRRDLRTADLNGATLAVGACDDDVEAEGFAVMARAAGVPVNVIDRPKFCDFSFGAIVNRSPLVIGVSTDGAAPVFAQAIRAKLEMLIPTGFARWMEAARSARTRVQSFGLSFRGRRQFWERFSNAAALRPDQAPDTADLDSWLAEARRNGARGTVVVVGVASDDPELLTLRAVRALQSADVIIADAGISSGVLDFARREARKLVVGRDAAPDHQDNLDALTLGLAKNGKCVVRLVTDASLRVSGFNSVVSACRRSAIPVEVVASFGHQPATTNHADASQQKRA